ncbi:glycosyltransferase family 39 protein [Tortispora caseinolytica NRRL Y-17796]|uniref:Dolichyl-phosphate-mannose--protein mannosyltransferase n=1 Tax=Tortispora caseinolytica NRRL Y-17796 TaxID=767744 RepID=A0A1E4TIW6_9ASCO|nr:glycosyltransferase family 39 protein [Tortispora caseinolytica NRRL Y-17796]
MAAKHRPGSKESKIKQSTPPSTPPKGKESTWNELTSGKSYKVACLLVTVLAFWLRFRHISHPDEVVFDEVHFGKFASYYLRRTYFFDVHPPFAKMLFAAVGWLVGYKGQFLFDNIGDSYIENNVPYVAYRALPALLGTMTVPTVFLTMKECGYSLPACLLSTALVLFDNGHVTQTRLILLDSTLIFSIAFSIYCYVRFYKERRRAFSFHWWKWLLLTGFALSCVISTKYVGVFTFITIGSAVAIDLWNLLDIKSGLTIRQVTKHFSARLYYLLVFPFMIYLFWFYVHFQVLCNSGPGDNFMTPEFQETLNENPLMKDARQVNYYDKITLRHSSTENYLHSHDQHYPLRYEDGRVSSQGQQVTAVEHPDGNSYWIIYPSFDEDVHVAGRAVKFGQRVRLYHPETNTFLLSHDVASPFYPTNQEFTAVSPENAAERFNFTLFEIRPIYAQRNEPVKTKAGLFKFVHVPSNVCMWTHDDKALPEWGFGQFEVNGNKDMSDRTNTWYIDEIIDLQDPERLNPPPKEVKTLPFLRKYFELQVAMLEHNNKLTSSHPYASQPGIWPVTLKGISFWTKNDTREQIYLVGNPAGWILEVVVITLFVLISIVDLLAAQRDASPLPEAVRHRFYASTGFFILAWATHYFPFFLMGRQLFLHHYLPAQLCAALAAGSMLDFLTGVMHDQVEDRSKGSKVSGSFESRASTVMAWLAAFTIISTLIGVFFFFAPLTYGTPGLSVEEVKERTWLQMNLHFAK